MIKVYHGSYVEVKTPDISFSRENVDFGKGFYVTPIREQAISWALRWVRRKKKSILNTYVFSEHLIAELGLKVKDFPAYDKEWLHFVADNRKGVNPHDYDVVCGGVANDKVFNTLELYFANLIPEDEDLNRLKYEKPNKQICICKQELIDRLLQFESSEEVSDGSK